MLNRATIGQLLEAKRLTATKPPSVLPEDTLIDGSGGDLGGNATAIGASANVVITGIAKRNGHPISFWTFTRSGLVVTAVTVGLCVPYVALRYFLLA